MRRRDDDDLALDRLAAPVQHGLAERVPLGAESARTDLQCQTIDDLRRELAALRPATEGRGELARIRNALVEARRTADEASRAAAALERSPARGLRLRREDSSALGLERQRVRLAEGHVAQLEDRERALADVVERAAHETPPAPQVERMAALEAEIDRRRIAHVARAQQAPDAYVTDALGRRPGHPRARQAWDRAVASIERYRFDFAVSDATHTLGPEPKEALARSRWRQTHRDIDRAQHSLGHTRHSGREL